MTEFDASFEVYPDVISVPDYGQFRIFRHDYISSIFFSGKVWEPHMHALFERHITKDSVVLEGGAHIGSHTVKLSMLAKKVYCFEPLWQSRALLMENLALNGCLNTVVSRKALGAEPGTACFGWVTDDNIGGAGLSRDGRQSNLEVEVTTIDALDLSQLDFIKLDIEQYEPLAIAGGMNTIEKFLPTIALECWDDYPKTSLQHAMTEYEALLDLGYTASQVDDNAPDYVFVHRDRG